MAKSKILVVEDEMIIAMEIEDRLENLGYEVVDVVSSGPEAIQVAADMQPHLVLMDIMLKGPMDGISAGTEIQARLNIPIIYLTAYADQNTLQRAKISEPFGYLLKPFEKRELQIAIEMALYKYEMEKKLRASEKWRTTILNSIGDGVMATDKQGHIAFMNPVGEQLTGWTEDEAFGQPLPQIFNIARHQKRSDDGHKIKEVPCEVVIGRPNHTILIAKDGTKRAIDESVAPIKDDHGELVGQVFVFRDISERQRIEEALHQHRNHLEELVEERTSELVTANQQLNKEIAERKRAERALQAERATLAQRVAERTIELNMANTELARAARLKDEFLANMSHELRTPLSAILGFSEILIEQTQGALNACQLKSLCTIAESGRHLLSLINDILDVSNIEACKLELEIDMVPVDLLVEMTLQSVKQMAKQKKIELSLKQDEQLPTLWADDRRLRQVLVNLLTNAVKFTDPEGKVGLEVRNDPEQKIVYFTVWDSGIGIPAKEMKRLFKPFVQVDSSLARHQGGTGLGLVLVSRLTEMHGGSLSIESEVGKGSRFTVCLPWGEPNMLSQAPLFAPSRHAPEKLAVKYKPKSRAHQPLLLLAEDNPHNINKINRYFTKLGYRIIVARNGLEAIERAKREQPALILMDIQMPRLDGLEAIRRIRADVRLTHVPIIALSALTMPGDRTRCFTAGANEYLNKPVGLKRLAQMIESLLAQAQEVRESERGGKNDT
ncbi:MAG: response regulator [Ardenticatenaceae bacterium]